MANDTYLGDGLYAAFDGFQIELYASDGARKTAAVYLEPETLDSFLRFVDEVRKQRTTATAATEEHKQERCILYESSFGWWIIVSAADPGKAWSGSNWVPHVAGFPASSVQICNFETVNEAMVYARAHELEVIEQA